MIPLITLAAINISILMLIRHDIKECENRTNGLSDDLQNKTKDVSCLQAMASDVQQRHDSVKTKLEEKILGYKVQMNDLIVVWRMLVCLNCLSLCLECSSFSRSIN